ncbi:hypothetical protein K438DRAFT_1446547, partial [Mycena galopus ATCC 62051]
PPGPKPKFIKGNLYNMPTKFPWLIYTEWCKHYGNVVHLQVFCDHILIFNSLEVAVELIEKQVLIYSDRPTIPTL